MIKKSIVQEDLITLSSQLSKMLKRSFGKGPDSCFCTYDNGVFCVRVKKFITPAEQVLLEKNEKSFAFKFRSIIMEKILDDFKVLLREVLEVDFERYYYDWNYHSNTGFIMYKKEGNSPPSMHMVDLEEKVLQTYSSIYKLPTEVTFSKVGTAIVLAQCNEVLLPIEKELFAQGNYNLLYEHRTYVKDSVIENKIEFAANFQQELQDIFLLWDYASNSNYLVFCLKATKREM